MLLADAEEYVYIMGKFSPKTSLIFYKALDIKSLLSLSISKSIAAINVPYLSFISFNYLTVGGPATYSPPIDGINLYPLFLKISHVFKNDSYFFF